MEGKTLFDILEQQRFAPLPEDLAKSLFRQAIEALSYSHENGFAHLDLKLENVMISSSGKLKIIDFGLCR